MELYPITGLVWMHESLGIKQDVKRSILISTSIAKATIFLVYATMLETKDAMFNDFQIPYSTVLRNEAN